MRKFFICLFVLADLFLCQNSYAFWMWTPETNKWVNPKFAVKDTPQKQLEYALESYKSQDWKKTIGELNKLIKHYPRSKEAPEAQFYIGECYEKQDDLMLAFRNYQMVVEKYPFSEKAGEVVKRQYEIGNKMLEGRAKRSRFLEAVKGSEYDVIEIFRTLIKNAPYGEYAAPSQYKIGLYLLEKQLYQEARDEFEKTINDYPDSEWAKAAKYQIALSDAKRSSKPQYDQKVTQIAIEELKTFSQNHPGAEFTDQAKQEILNLREKEAENSFVVAQFYEKQKQFDAAKIYYTAIVENYNNTTWASKALEKLQKINKKR